MEKQNIINKRIELENIEEVAKILLRRQEELVSKAKQGEEETQYSNNKIKKYKISMNNVTAQIVYKDGMRISRDNQYNWLISEMYTNRAKIETIWIKYHGMYYLSYEVGANNQFVVEEYNIWIHENSLHIDARSKNCDDIVYATINEIKNIFMKCPDKYDETIKGKFFRSQALYLAIGLAVAILLSLFTKFTLMPKYEILSTALNNKVVFILAFIFTAEFSGTAMGNGIISSMYKRISPKQKYVGYNKNTRTSTYVDDIDDYKSNSEIMIGVNAYNTRDRIKIENMFKVCKKIILIELIVSLIVGVIFFFI